MYVIQIVPGHPGGFMTGSHEGFYNLFYIDGGVMRQPIATIADERLAVRVRDLLNQHGMEGVDMALIELPPPAYVGTREDDGEEED